MDVNEVVAGEYRFVLLNWFFFAVCDLSLKNVFKRRPSCIILGHPHDIHVFPKTQSTTSNIQMFTLPSMKHTCHVKLCCPFSVYNLLLLQRLILRTINLKLVL